jgi:hypothetical protein
VTTVRPQARAPQRPLGQWPVGERSLINSVLGIPPLAAVGLAFGFTALGVFVDLQRIGTVGAVFQVLYFCGCLLAMSWVRRRNLFAPLVQPPLLLAVAVPAIVLMGDHAGGGGGSTLLTVGAPLVNSFPTMAVTSGVVLALGLLRFVVQREARTGEADGRPARTADRPVGKAGRGGNPSWTGPGDPTRRGRIGRSPDAPIGSR